MAEQKNTSVGIDPKAFEAQMQAILDAAQKRAEEIIEAAEKKAAEISESRQGVSGPMQRKQNKPEEKVKIRLPKNRNESDDLPISVNGNKPWLIKRGEWVEVPRSIAEIIENSQRQDEAALEYSERLSDEYESRDILH